MPEDQQQSPSFGSTRKTHALAREIEAEFHGVVDVLINHDAPEDHLRVALKHARALRQAFEASPPGSALWGKATTGDGLRGMVVMGRASPPPDPARLSTTDDEIEAIVTFDSQHEGPDGSAHGGYIAHVYDDLLAFTQSLSGSRYGVTRSLEVTYRKRTPLHRPIRIVCRVQSVEEGTVIAVGQSFLVENGAETLLSEATATFRHVAR